MKTQRYALEQEVCINSEHESDGAVQARSGTFSGHLARYHNAAGSWSKRLYHGRAIRVVQYDRLKARFLHFVNMHEHSRLCKPKPLPRLDRRFDLAWYLQLHQHRVFEDIVRISKWSWVLIITGTMPLLRFTLLFDDKKRCEAFVACGYVVLVGAMVLHGKMRRILHVLTPDMPAASGQRAGAGSADPDGETKELNPAAVDGAGGAVDSSVEVGGGSSATQSLTAELHPPVVGADGASPDHRRMVHLVPQAHHIGLPGSHTGLFWAPCLCGRAAMEWGVKFTRNLLSATLLTAAGYTAVFFQGVRGLILTEFGDHHAEPHAHDEPHRRSLHESSEAGDDHVCGDHSGAHSHGVSYAVFAVALSVTMALLLTRKCSLLVAVALPSFLVWACGAVSIQLLPLCIYVADLSPTALGMVILAAIPPLLSKYFASCL